MDLSDKNFKPCPCGYQICQFCYNNIISNPDLNHNCPACRRIYSKDTVEYKVLSADELNVLKLKQLEKQRKRKQREKEQRDAEQASKKHLAGMRVIQKNLVYVVGLNLPGSSDELQTLFRSDAYFGQYGKINKVVVNRKSPNAANSHSSAGLSVYVTFSRKEDALRCIQAVDGSISDGRALKAAHGTTKYCSSYLRGQQCPNPNCMFLHEPGEEAESYNRENMSNRRVHAEVRSAIHGLAPPANATPTMPNASLSASTSQNNLYQIHSNGNGNGSGNGAAGSAAAPNYRPAPSDDEEKENGPALPASANWGKVSSSTNLYNMSQQLGQAPVDASSSAATAFPTLGESVQTDPSGAVGGRRKDRRRDDGSHEYSDSASDAMVALRGIIEALTYFDPSFVRFNDGNVDQAAFGSFPKLFNLTPGTAPMESSRDTKRVSERIVDNLLVNKTNNHVMGIQNIQFILQMNQQAQAARQQQAAKFPAADAGAAALAAAQQQQQYLLQQQRLQRLQQQQAQPGKGQSATPLTPTANLAMLQAQDAQAQAQQQAQNFYLQQQQQQQAAAAAQMAGADTDASNTPTAAPPPGLFSGVQLPNVAKSDTPSNNAASSELLSHLLGGKK